MILGTLPNSKDPDIMLHNVAFIKVFMVKALPHYNVLANVCRRMKYISSTLAYA